MKKHDPNSPPKSQGSRFSIYSLILFLIFVVVIFVYYNPFSVLKVPNRNDTEDNASSNSVITDEKTWASKQTSQQGLDDIVIPDDVTKDNLQQLRHHIEKKTQELAGTENDLEGKLDLYRQYLKTYNTMLTYLNDNIAFTKQIEYLNKITFPLSLQASLDNLSRYNQALITGNRSDKVVFPKSDGLINNILKPVIQIRTVNKVDKNDILRSVDLLTNYIYSKTFMRRFIEND